MPSEIASTPVIAVQPLANAVSSRKIVSGPLSNVASGSTGATTGVDPARLPRPGADRHEQQHQLPMKP